MQDKENGDSGFYRAEDVLEYVGAFLGSDLCRYISQCDRLSCRTFWFSGGEWKIKEKIEERIREGKNKPGSFERMRRAIIVLNMMEPISPDELAKGGIINVSHGPCQLCTREDSLRSFHRHQRKQGFPDCFGTAYRYCNREKCEENRQWDCAHPCTIHPEREKIRSKRMKLIKIYKGGTKNG